MQHAISTKPQREPSANTVKDLVSRRAPDWLYILTLVVVAGMAAYTGFMIGG